MFHVLHSSAGAGKTHAVVKHYLNLALASDDPADYTRILALTFTTKAAAEMRERILHYLGGLAASEVLSVALTDVRDAVTASTGIPAALVRERARKTLIHMLHHWPQMAVSTIDAFTRRVVMPFARDLRLDSELRMTTEEQDYRDMAVDRLLEEAGTDAALTELLIAICEDLVGAERDWRADKPLRALSTQLTKEQAILHLEQLRELGSAHFLAIRQRLRSETHDFREKLRALGKDLLVKIEAAGLTDDDLYYGKGGPVGYFRALATFDTWLDEKKNTLKALEKDKWASDKASSSAKSAIEQLAPAFRDAVRTTEDLRGTGELQLHAMACAVLNDLLPSAALHLMDERLETIKREEGVTFFSDLVKKVAAIAQREPAPFLYERLGERYRHFLIDEFQDTSMLQWHALLPLVTNALSTGGSALLVGDAKQAIYRWRNGEARQFTRLPALFGKERMVEGEDHEAALTRAFRPVEPLVANYRSARAIIRFNNDLFDALRETLPEHYRDVYHAQAQQNVKDHEGHVHIACLAPTADDDGADDVPPAALRTVAAVRDSLEDGFVPGEVAVLVRTKAQARTIAEHLVSEGFEIVSPDGLSLGADAGVRAVIALLAWIQRPDHVTAAHAAQTLDALDAPNGQATCSAMKPVERMRAWQREHADARAQSTLLVLLQAIIRILAINPVEDAFVMGLLNEAHLFTTEHGDDAAGFLDHWDRTAADRTVSAADNLNAIRVMTVHASKGLQFPVVIVPYSDMGTRGNRDRIWIDPRAVAPDLPAALVKPGKALEAIGLPELSEEEDLARLDMMDLLYVAFTRPEQRLYAFFDGGRKSGIGADARAVLGLAPGDVQESGIRSPAIPSKARNTAGTATLTLAAPGAPILLEIRKEVPDNWDPLDPDPSRSLGNAIHAILARVRVPADLDEAIETEARIQGMDPEQQRRVHQLLAELLAKPGSAPWFGPGLRVLTEATLIDRLGNAHRPDRVTFDGKTTRVLDIKTGVRSEKHHEQVERYISLLRETGEAHVTGHLLYVAEGAFHEVGQGTITFGT